MLEELYRTHDEFGLVIVLEKGDRRILSFDSSLQQSCVYMNKPYLLAHEYTQIMLLGMVLMDARNVTLLGLGGGGLAHCFNHYYPQVAMRVVELRQAVIDVAYQWFNLPQKANLKVTCDDAFHYMQKAKAQSIDLLLSDLYEAQGMSEIQSQFGFIQQAYNSLSDDGWLVLNLHHNPEEDAFIMQSVNELFSNLYLCEVFSGNWVLFCGKAASQYDKNELNERARHMGKKLGIQLSYYYKQLKCIK